MEMQRWQPEVQWQVQEVPVLKSPLLWPQLLERQEQGPAWV